MGSTGSIGRQTLEVAESLDIPVRALSARSNIKLLEEQIRKFKPAVAAVLEQGPAADLKARVRDLDLSIVTGMDGLIDAACVDGAGTVVTAVVGADGLLPTLAATDMGRRIALANKETLVCAGALVMERARQSGAEILPVDSEHSALFQCLRGRHMSEVKNLLLTASGGPFRGKPRAALINATPEMALRHPNWSMGKKVTIDSATMMNKGLEVIEASHLFSVSAQRIKVLVHPESIVHSMVEFSDNSIIAQLACPDMRLPIQYALTYPHREPSLAAGLDLSELSALTFYKPDFDAFPCLALAYETARTGGTACAALNGANEAAVGLFIKGGISFYDIYELVRAAVDNIKNIENPSLEDIIATDESAKRFVFERAGRA